VERLRDKKNVKKMAEKPERKGQIVNILVCVG
jgi:hypothetical protein